MRGWRNTGIALGLIAAIITILSFTTGIFSLRQLLVFFRRWAVVSHNVRPVPERSIPTSTEINRFEDTFDNNGDWVLNGNYAAPNFAFYPGIRGWERGTLAGERHPKNHAYLNIAGGIVSGCSSGYGHDPQLFEPTTIHRELAIDGRQGFTVEFRAISAADWPNSVTVYLLADWQRGRKRQKYYGFQVYGESSNHTIDIMSTALDSLSDLMYRYKAGTLVNAWHTYTFCRLADGTFELLVDGEKVEGFKPGADREYNHFNRIAVSTLRKGSKIDWVRVKALGQSSREHKDAEMLVAQPAGALPLDSMKCISKPESAKGKTFPGDEVGGTLADTSAGWDGDFRTYLEARSNGNHLSAITWETTEVYRIPPTLGAVWLRAKTEQMNWQSHVQVYVYDFAEGAYILAIGGQKATDGVRDNVVRLDKRHVNSGEIRVRALLFAKHSARAYARYYESAILHNSP
jgi:hypothetical protein